MKKLLSGLLVLGLAFALGAGATGCKKGTANNNANRSGNPPGGNVSYKLSTESVNLAPGGESTITVTRSGSKDKWTEQDIKAEITQGKDLITIQAAKFSKDGDRADVTVKAPGDSKGGTAKVHIKVGDLDNTVTVTVKAKEQAGDGKEKEGKTTYAVSSREVTVEAGKDAKVTVTRTGGKLEDQAVSVKVEGNDKVSAEAQKFAGEAKETVITIKAAAGATGEATVHITVGSFKDDVKVKVGGKGKTKSGLRTPNRNLARDERQVESVPAVRASFRRELILFTRES